MTMGDPSKHMAPFFLVNYTRLKKLKGAAMQRRVDKTRARYKILFINLYTIIYNANKAAS
jgi:hypothetical protein